MARGDREALGELFRLHSARLLPIGWAILKSRSDAEEVLHEVFLEAWRSARLYDPARGSVRAWLVVRMRSRSLDRRKSDPLSRHVPWAEQAEEAPAPLSSKSPERALEYARMKTALELVPAEQRAVLLLGYFEGLSSSEIAEQLGIPVGTVKSRVRMGLLRLKQILEGEETS